MISRSDFASAHRTHVKFADPGGGGTLVHTGPLILFAMTVTADEVNDAKIVLFDATSATGRNLRIHTPISTSTTQTWEPMGIRFTTGLFVRLGASGGGWTTCITYVAE